VTRLRLLGPAAGLLAAIVLTWLGGLRLNLTGSMPVGLYRVSAGPPQKGAMVLACLPVAVGLFARSRGYVPHGSCPGGAAPIGKVVLATAGDSVRVTDSGLRVNGRRVANTKPLAADGAGRPLPRVHDGAYVVASDEVWLYSPYSKRSFDSRYFGPVPLRCVRHRVLPLWTVR
jgi:conjugative transfer signal peptidase TraF